MKHTRTSKDGLTLLVALLFTGVALAISSSLLSITLKQYQLSRIGLSSETAFQAANAAMECALYYDNNLLSGIKRNSFDVPNSGVPITCMGVLASPDPLGPFASGQEQKYQFNWSAGSSFVCSEISVYKFYSDSVPQDMDSVGITNRDCDAGTECTVVKTRGYNNACNNLTTRTTVERELTLVY